MHHAYTYIQHWNRHSFGLTWNIHHFFESLCIYISYIIVFDFSYFFSVHVASFWSTLCFLFPWWVICGGTFGAQSLFSLSVQSLRPDSYSAVLSYSLWTSSSSSSSAAAAGASSLAASSFVASYYYHHVFYNIIVLISSIVWSLWISDDLCVGKNKIFRRSFLTWNMVGTMLISLDILYLQESSSKAKS